MDSIPDGYTIGQRITDEAREAVDAKVRAWMDRTTELAAYDLEAVKEIGRHTT